MNANEAALFERLAVSYAEPEWCLVAQVPDRIGFRDRTADAMALNAWSSRGYALHGFEFKVSRGDWLRELRQPNKADPLVKHCDRWWVLASDPGIVQDGELPQHWGLLLPHGKGVKAKVVAGQLQPEPWSREFMAGVFRRVYQSQPGKLTLDSAAAAAEQQIRDQVYVEFEQRLTELRDHNSDQARRLNRISTITGGRLTPHSTDAEVEAFALELATLLGPGDALQRSRRAAGAAARSLSDVVARLQLHAETASVEDDE